MGVSIREYARLRGVSDTAVHKALKQGRITAEPDGSIDVDRANKEWEENTQTLSSKGTSYTQARTANEVLKAQTNQVRLKQLKGQLIDRDAVASHVFKLARQERDAWQTWPSRISSQMAAALEIEPHQLHVTLERYVREHLEELSTIQLTL